MMTRRTPRQLHTETEVRWEGPAIVRDRFIFIESSTAVDEAFSWPIDILTQPAHVCHHFKLVFQQTKIIGIISNMPASYLFSAICANDSCQKSL